MTNSDADAAFFEDWSPWATLDGKPVKPSVSALSRPIVNDGQYSRYGCELRVRTNMFMVDVPPDRSICAMIEKVPGAARAKKSISPGSYTIPAAKWRELRAILPAIKQAIIDREEKSRSQSEHYKQQISNVANIRLQEAITGNRDINGQIDAICNAQVLKDQSLTGWERKFISGLMDRRARDNSHHISEKQLSIIIRIHDKIKHRVVL